VPKQEPLGPNIFVQSGREKDGKPYYRLKYRDASGKYRYTGLGRGTNRELNERAREFLRQLDSTAGEPVVRGGQKTVAQAWAEYEQDKLRDLRKSTRTGYASIWRRHLEPNLAGLAVRKVTRDRLRDVLDTTTAGLSVKTRNHVLEVMKAFFAWCVDQGYAATNPAGKIAKLRGPEPVKLAATSADIHALMRELEENWSKQDHLLVWTLATTGLRFGEALALRWGDLFARGWKANEICVKQDFVRGEVGAVKTKKSERTVPMTKRLSNALQTEFHIREYNGVTFEDYVFTNGAGNPLCGDDWRKRVFMPASKKSCTHFRIKDLRDFAITRWVESGDMNLLEVQEVAGHTQAQTTMGYFRRSGMSIGKARNATEGLGF